MSMMWAHCDLNLRAVFLFFFLFFLFLLTQTTVTSSPLRSVHTPLAMSSSAVPSARVDASAVASVKRALQAWEASFERQKGRRAQAKDVQGHNIGQSLCTLPG